uniref:Uncharacterized protein n=1 Tax=Panagrolaimus sp. JU765 TaxID=591449 RepID=A0AC34RIL7_9BILA
MLRLTVRQVGRQIKVQQTRNTYILEHVHPPPVTPPGQKQRPPTENQNYQKYNL